MSEHLKRWTDEQAADIAKSIVEDLVEEYLSRGLGGYYNDDWSAGADVDPDYNHATREGGCRLCCGGIPSEEGLATDMLNCPSVGQIRKAIEALQATVLVGGFDWRVHNEEDLQIGDVVVVTEGRYAGRIGLCDDDIDVGILYLIFANGEAGMVAESILRPATDDEIEAWDSTTAISKWAGRAPENEVQ